jgi:ER membrane protein complex subunit 6
MATPSDSAAAQLICPANVQANSSLVNVKFLSCCFAGAAAGILGLENWAGFILYLTTTLFTALCIHSVNCHGKSAKYLSGGFTELLIPSQDDVFTFVLVWTLFYGTLCRTHLQVDITV